MSSRRDDAGRARAALGGLRSGVVRASARSVAAGAARPDLLALLVLLAAVVAVVWADQPGVFTPDTVPALYTAPGRLLQSDLSTWVPDPFLGSANLQAGRAPVSAALALLELTGLPDWALLRLWRSLLLVVAALGAHALYRGWAGPGSGRGAAVAMAAVYTVNPYVVVGGSTTPTLLPYALLPWAVLALVRSCRAPGWRAPAAFALLLLAMSGIQVGVVPLLQLLVVPVVVLDARLRGGVPWRTAGAGVLRCAVLALLVSAYWVVPALQAVAVGSAVAAATETNEVIAGPSSAAEVLRGLGMWTMYGRDAGGPFQPGFVPYLTDPLVVLASSALPVLAALGAAASRSRLRVAGVLALAVAVPVMVGLHPFEDPTPFGRLLAAGFETVPGLIAFRTTNKAGGVLLIGLALLVALLVERLAASVRGRRRRVVLAAVGVALLAGTAAPAVSGPLHPVRLDVPAYWEQAAAALDAAPERGRVLVLPGTHVPSYRWGYTSSADHLEGLFERGTVQRQGVPNGGAQAGDLLAALDTALQEGGLDPRVVSTLARYLGVQDVVLRHDVVWEAAAGARPAEVAARIADDPGLELVGEHGAPGENVVAPAGAPEGTEQQRSAEAALAPVQHYRVLDPVPQVRAGALAGTVLVDGDASALPDLVAAGVLDGRPGLRLLAGMSPEEVESALADGARVVLTDSARRRDTAAGRLTAATGPTLPAHAQPTRPLGAFSGDPSAQTVQVLPGARVSATRSGSQFGPVPYGGPVQALDGDPRTGWQPGDFGSAVGQRLDLRLDEPTEVRRVRLTPLDTTGPRLTEVRLRVGAAERVVRLSAGTRTTVTLPPRDVQDVSVTVTATEGTGPSSPGLAELVLEGVPLEPTTRLPGTLAAVREQLSPRGRVLLDLAPQDVVLARSRARDATPVDDEETRLARDLVTTGTRNLDVGGALRAGPDVPEQALDVLAGADPLVSATSSSRFADSPDLRASRAVDGDLGTAWVPGGDAVGESMVLAFPARPVDQLVLRQDPAANEVVDLVSRVRVDLEDGRSVESAVGPGETTIALPPGVDVGLVRLTVLDRLRVGDVVRIADVDVAGVRVQPDPVRAATACVPVAVLSGEPVLVRADAAALTAGIPAPFSSCGVPLRLGPGEQQLRTSPGWLLDRVHLRDLRAAPEAPGAPPVTVATSDSPTAWRVDVSATDRPYALVLGQGQDPRWRASVDGRDLGPPGVLDAWSVGWRVPAAGPHVVQVRYAPEDTAVVARAVSLLGVLGCLALLVPLRRRRSAAPSVPDAAPAAAVPVATGSRSEVPEDGRRRWARVAGWAAVPALMWLLGGPVVGGAGVAVAVLGARSARARRALPWAGALLLALVPVARLAGGLPDPAAVSAEAATGAVPALLAQLGLALLVVGVLAQELDLRRTRPAR